VLEVVRSQRMEVRSGIVYATVIVDAGLRSTYSRCTRYQGQLFLSITYRVVRRSR
jgi:hypothetical protein